MSKTREVKVAEAAKGPMRTHSTSRFEPGSAEGVRSEKVTDSGPAEQVKPDQRIDDIGQH